MHFAKCKWYEPFECVNVHGLAKNEMLSLN